MSFIQFRAVPGRSQRADVRQVFEQFLGQSASPPVDRWTPRVDVREQDDRFVILADIPGVDPQSIELQMDQGVLTLSGERASESVEEAGHYARRERATGSFKRSFSLPDTADADAVTASNRHGVLRIDIPKRAQATPRRIQVQ